MVLGEVYVSDRIMINVQEAYEKMDSGLADLNVFAEDKTVDRTKHNFESSLIVPCPTRTSNKSISESAK